jgi:hypothetical protein
VQYLLHKLFNSFIALIQCRLIAMAAQVKVLIETACHTCKPLRVCMKVFMTRAVAVPCYELQGSKGNRSGFRFPAAAPKVGGARIAGSGKQTAAFSLPAAASAAGRAGGARKGNPKKTNKQQRKEEKAAKKAAK